ncbi:MAG: Lrp/AsnC family transcriptional regulator [Solirubrobacteraceae bacterium]|nr:Lrp/AsnC family transcriptional regulator [Solirubrobacteraceae bacterium]
MSDRAPRARRGQVALDETDKAILRELQHDGRMSYAALGPKVGLSAPAVRQRIQRLTDSGVLHVVGVTDPLALGLPVMAMLGVRADGDVREIADRIGEVDAVIYLVLTSGAYDLLVEVVCREPHELLDVVNDHIKAIPGVRSVESLVYLDIHTHRFTWGVP